MRTSAAYDGRVSVLHQKADTDVAALRTTLSAYGEILGEIALVPTFAPGKSENRYCRWHDVSNRCRVGGAELMGLLGEKGVPVCTKAARPN